jgi:general L-amino acid transport system substrate-binding protein
MDSCGRRAADFTTMLCATTAALLIALASFAAAGETLAQIKSRGSVRCGVSEGIAGFSTQEKSGRWAGLDADFCRAVAAAALGDAEKVAFIPLRASARFPSLKLGQIDLLARQTTWTLQREAALRVQFAGILYYDGQGFMTPAAGAKSISQLNGATICVEKGTTHELNLADYFAARRLRVKPVVVDSTAGVADEFFAGRCKAYTSDVSQLAAVRLRAQKPQAWSILSERISKEPLGPAVRRGDDDWLALVRWVLFALVAAEEHGITQKSAGEPAAERLLSTDAEINKALGVEPGWAARAVRSGGNYGEIFDRNVGKQSALKLERGLNRLWTDRGLMYAPPFR